MGGGGGGGQGVTACTRQCQIDTWSLLNCGMKGAPFSNSRLTGMKSVDIVD